MPFAINTIFYKNNPIIPIQFPELDTFRLLNLDSGYPGYVFGDNDGSGGAGGAGAGNDGNGGSGDIYLSPGTQPARNSIHSTWSSM